MWHLLAACLFSLCSTDPLDRLERDARAFSAWEASYDAPTGGDRLSEYLRLHRLVESVLGVRVQGFGAPPETSGAIGRMVTTDPDGTEHVVRVIALNSTLSPNARLEVLAHEAGHLLQPPGLTDDEGQVFADAVSYLVTRGNRRTYARYLSGHKSSLRVLKTYRREIQWAAKVLSGR